MPATATRIAIEAQSSAARPAKANRRDALRFKPNGRSVGANKPRYDRNKRTNGHDQPTSDGARTGMRAQRKCSTTQRHRATKETDHVHSIPGAKSTRLSCHIGDRIACRFGRRGRVQLLLISAGSGGRSEFDPPLHRQLPAGRDRRAAPAHRCHALARARVGVRRSFPADLVDPGGRRHTRRATRHDAETHPVLGNGIRLEQVRGAV